MVYIFIYFIISSASISYTNTNTKERSSTVTFYTPIVTSSRFFRKMVIVKQYILVNKYVPEWSEASLHVPPLSHHVTYCFSKIADNKARVDESNSDR